MDEVDTELGLSGAIVEAFELFAEENGEEMPEVKSFRDEGLLTDTEGLVIRLPNGAEFQVAITQTREAGEE